MKQKDKGVFSGTPTYIIVLVLMLAGLLLSLVVAVTFGSISIPIGDVYGVIMHKLFGMSTSASASVHDVVWLIRLPRLILAVAVGMALSVSGVAMQAIVRNPLAEPSIMGINSGAYAGATMALLMGMGSAIGGNFVGIVAFIGAFLSSIAVVAIASIGGRPSSIKLVLSGSAVGAVCMAAANFLIYFTNQSNQVQAIVNWTMGSLARAKWDTNLVVLLVVLATVMFLWSQHRSLNLMLMGDETAVTLGTKLHLRRVVYMLASSLMVGFAVYSAGMISFVGLVIPHIMRMLFGVDHKKLVPLSALAGAIFLVWADVLCRIAIPGAELPIGIFTSIIGAPVFVYLMARNKYGFGGGE